MTPDQIENLLNASPPEDLNRYLKSLGDLGIERDCVVAVTVNPEVILEYRFSFCHPYKAFGELYESILISNAGPVFEYDEKVCPCGRMPNFSVLVQKFAEKMGFDLNDKENLTLVVSMYSDGTQTKSGNVKLTPLWGWLSTMDIETRMRLGEHAYVLLTLLVDPHSMEYKFSDGSGRQGCTLDSCGHGDNSLRFF